MSRLASVRRNADCVNIRLVANALEFRQEGGSPEAWYVVGEITWRWGGSAWTCMQVDTLAATSLAAARVVHDALTAILAIQADVGNSLHILLQLGWKIRDQDKGSADAWRSSG